jgi:hypothetical protein
MKWFRDKNDDDKLGLYTDVETNTGAVSSKMCQNNQATGECSRITKIRELQAELRDIESQSPDTTLDKLLCNEEECIKNQVGWWTNAIIGLFNSNGLLDEYIKVLENYGLITFHGDLPVDNYK